jgi:hypothetical protein
MNHSHSEASTKVATPNAQANPATASPAAFARMVGMHRLHPSCAERLIVFRIAGPGVTLFATEINVKASHASIDIIYSLDVWATEA